MERLCGYCRIALSHDFGAVKEWRYKWGYFGEYCRWACFGGEWGSELGRKVEKMVESVVLLENEKRFVEKIKKVGSGKGQFARMFLIISSIVAFK